MFKIFLKDDKEKFSYHPHPWIFSGALKKEAQNRNNEIVQRDEIPNGSIVKLYFADSFISIGYYSNSGSIAYRRLSWKDELIDVDFFKQKFIQQKQFIESIINFNTTNCYRLVYGENSSIPGLIIDIYDSVASIQFHTAGVESLKKEIIEALIETINPKSIIIKNRIQARSIEGLPLYEKWVYGTPQKEILVKENSIFFNISIEDGQKTGFFIDQRENRKKVAQYFKKGNLLNLFGYNGGFNLYLKGKKSVNSINVDISEEAQDSFNKNIVLNNMEPQNHIFLKKDIFKMVRDNNLSEIIGLLTTNKTESNNKNNLINSVDNYKFDAIVLDPPALAKSVKQKQNAIKEYIELNRFALKNIKNGGFLFTASCTSVVSSEDFEFIIYQAALKERKNIKILEKNLNSLDHPINPFFPEGIYLKFYVIYIEGDF
ncbi:class I SAM-dependent rRNA methyltransferase [bacterium]|nr:class I SAM-dependent rRNA methyltransferase [bacterium]